MLDTFRLFIALGVFIPQTPFAHSSVHGLSEKSVGKGQYRQWFTGPLLTPTPITMPKGHPGLEIAWLVGDSYGKYDARWKFAHGPRIWSTGPYFDFQIGFNRIVGGEFIGALITKFGQGKSSTHLIDSIFRLGFQITTDQKNSWVPDFRILLQETVPTGKYDKLNPQKKGTDLTGQGSFQTGGHLAFQKLFKPKSNHSFRLRWSVGYFVLSTVNVKGMNYLGGTVTSKGKVYPANIFTNHISGEYALSRTWAVCVESNCQFSGKGKFSKKQGPHLEVPPFAQVSIAAEIQHTFTPRMGIIMGSWVTLTGKNSEAFRNYFISILYQL